MSKLKGPMEELLASPDRRAKLYLLLTVAQICSIIALSAGIVVFILWALGIIGF